MEAHPKSGDRYRQGLGAQTGALAGPARDLSHVLLELFALGLGVGLRVSALDVVDDPLERRVVRALTAVAIAIPDVDLLVRSDPAAFPQVSGSAPQRFRAAA